MRLVWLFAVENMLGKISDFLGVCLSVLGLWWGPGGPWMGILPLPDVDELLCQRKMWLGWGFVVA